jgi:O-antigen/teichoic acid export membrane protein
LKSNLSALTKTFKQDVATITSIRRIIEIALTPLYRNAFYLMLVTALTSLFGFFFWIIVARYYSEVEVGYSSAIISAISLLTIISMAGLNSLLIRFLPQTEKPQELINSSLTLGGLFSIGIAIVFIAGLNFWSPALSFIRESNIFTAAFIVFTLLWTISTLINTVFVARRRAGFVLSKSTIYAVIKLPLPILFVSFWHSFGVVASWGIAVAIVVGSSFLFFIPAVEKQYKPLPTFKSSTIRNAWHYSAGSYMVNLLSASIGFILPIMVVNLLDSMQNAYFYIAWMIASAVFAIPRSVSLSLFAEGSHFEDKLGENLVKSLKFTFLLLIPAAIVVFLTGKWLLLIFGQSYSLNALKLLWVLCISSLPVTFNNLYTSILRVEGRLKELIAIWGCISLPVLLVSYLIIPATGIIGVGYAWLGTHTIVAIYVLLKSRGLRLLANQTSK